MVVITVPPPPSVLRLNRVPGVAEGKVPEAPSRSTGNRSRRGLGNPV
ncbi:hypothetical protein N177_3291 [Lutibaculum baratangense AMV1]|uniref:Uncharacterized protein n=1 Tax=Lutibaculum baratangense AMV1 TaxID=631454 RepID=V4T9N2_9HYPH|nr:hypothetical protein N177_3291 [Lutibaculum baratangense AMV1]